MLGFTHAKTPCKATYYNVLKEIDKDLFEEKVGKWAGQHLGGGEEDAGIAVDGKTLRGSKKQGASASHLLSAVGHQWGVTLHQQSVDVKTNEIPMLIPLLEDLSLEGRVVTMDALLTQNNIAEEITEKGGDYHGG